MANVKKLFSLDESIARELKDLSKIMKKTQKEIVENALDFYFDYTDVIVADSVTRDIQNGDMKVYDSKSAYKELGIDI